MSKNIFSLLDKGNEKEITDFLAKNEDEKEVRNSISFYLFFIIF